MEEKNRTESFDSIPEAGFVKEFVACQIKELEQNELSKYKKMEINGELKPEPLLAEDKSRFVLFPIKYTDVSETFLFGNLNY